MRLAAVLSFALLGGCSSSSAVETAPVPQTVRVVGGASPGAIALGMTATPADARSTTVAAPIADVWRVLPAAYASFDIPLSTIDSTTHLIGNQGFNVRRRLATVPLVRLIDCGSTQGGPSADTYDIKMSVLTRVQATDAGTTFSTTVEPMGKPAAFASEYIRCSSTGVLEARLADAVKARLVK